MDEWKTHTKNHKGAATAGRRERDRSTKDLLLQVSAHLTYIGSAHVFSDTSETSFQF